MEEFGVSNRMVRNARALKAAKGLLALPDKKIGKRLDEVVKLSVKQFFEDDEFSRICPGKKDYVSVRIEGKKVQM